MTAFAAAGREPANGWVIVVAAGVTAALGFGALASVAVFLKPLAAEFGWSRGEVSFAYTLGTAATAVLGVPFGRLADRVPTRPIAVFGAVMLGLPFLALNWLEALWQLYALYALLGGLGFGALSAPVLANVSRWFGPNRGLAIGIVTAGGAVGQGLVPLLAGWLIVAYDWRAAFLGLGILSIAAGLPLVLLFREPPGEAPAIGAGIGAPPDLPAPLAPAVATAWVSAAAVFCCVCMAVPIVHVVALVSDLGFAPETGAVVLAIIMVAGAVGRILIGRLADRIGGLRAYMLTSLGQTLLVFWFVQLDSVRGFYAMSVLFGLAYAGVMTSLILTTRELVPARHFGFAVAIVVMFGWFGMGLGGLQAGLLYDLTGSYLASYGAAVAAGALNLAILAALFVRVRPPRPQPAAG